MKASASGLIERTEFKIKAFDLFALSFVLRKRLVVSHYHDDIGDSFSEFLGDHLDRQLPDPLG